MKALLVCHYLFPLNHLSLIVHPSMIIRECVCLFLCVIHVISFLRLAQSKQCFPSLGHLLFMCVGVLSEQCPSALVIFFGVFRSQCP